MPSKPSETKPEITTINDLNDKERVSLFTDSQDVKAILEELNCTEDYGGIFVYNGIAYGFEGSVPYRGKQLYRIGEYDAP